MLDPIVNFFTGLFQWIGRGIGFVVGIVLWPFMWVGRWYGQRGLVLRAVVGLIRPEGLAEGAATTPPKACSKSCATGWAGTRIATVSSPAVTSDAIPAS